MTTTAKTTRWQRVREEQIPAHTYFDTTRAGAGQLEPVEYGGPHASDGGDAKRAPYKRERIGAGWIYYQRVPADQAAQ